MKLPGPDVLVELIPPREGEVDVGSPGVLDRLHAVDFAAALDDRELAAGRLGRCEHVPDRRGGGLEGPRLEQVADLRPDHRAIVRVVGMAGAQRAEEAAIDACLIVPEHLGAPVGIERKGERLVPLPPFRVPRHEDVEPAVHAPGDELVLLGVTDAGPRILDHRSLAGDAEDDVVARRAVPGVQPQLRLGPLEAVGRFRIADRVGLAAPHPAVRVEHRELVALVPDRADVRDRGAEPRRGLPGEAVAEVGGLALGGRVDRNATPSCFSSRRPSMNRCLRSPSATGPGAARARSGVVITGSGIGRRRENDPGGRSRRRSGPSPRSGPHPSGR